MIADWTVDIGPDSPMIVVPWEGWVDPRAGLHPLTGAGQTLDVLEMLPEVRAYPELLVPMQRMNRLNCLTSKVDVFSVTRDDADPEIAEAGELETAHGLASYLDVLTVRHDVFSEFADFERLARKTAAALKQCLDLPLSSAEIVLRPARMRYARLGDVSTFGWTLYAMGFGETEAQARERWSNAYGLLTCILGLEVCWAVNSYRKGVRKAGEAPKGE